MLSLISLPYGLYMAEAEGYLGPHSDTIPDIIRDASMLIRSGESVAAAMVEASALNGVDYSKLTPEETKRIRQAL